MIQYKRIGIDTSKAVFTLHGIDQQERPVLRVNLRRAQMVACFRKLPPTVIALEACRGSHYWARELAALGHTVRLIPPQYVKPYVKRGKNDRNAAIEKDRIIQARMCVSRRPFYSVRDRLDRRSTASTCHLPYFLAKNTTIITITATDK